MKKIYSILMMMIVTSLTSCNKDNEIEKIDTNLSTFNLDFGEATKAEDGETLELNRYVMAVYDEIGAKPVNVFGDTNIKVQLGNTTFKAEFEKTKNYTVIFWADNESTKEGVVYDVTDFKNIHLKEGAEPIDAFHGETNVEGDKTAPKSISMIRSIANIKLFEKGDLKKGDIIKLSYKTCAFLNIVSNNINSNKQQIEKTIVLDSDIKNNGINLTELGSFYTLAETLYTTNVSIKLNNNEPIIINNINIISGKIINIIGRLGYLNNKNEITFNLEDFDTNWSGKLSLEDRYYDNYCWICLSEYRQYAGINGVSIDNYILPIENKEMEHNDPKSYLLIDKKYTTIKKGTKIELPFYNYGSSITDKYFVDIWIDWEQDGTYYYDKDLVLHKAIDMKEGGQLCETVTYTFNTIPDYAKDASYMRIVSYFLDSDNEEYLKKCYNTNDELDVNNLYEIACSIEK
ncbi:MAG: hypothetical protein IMY73_02380 [Bacteroidetes bacterium]|nr:hypothetical protein [Bacteroidota bacterium]